MRVQRPQRRMKLDPDTATLSTALYVSMPGMTAVWGLDDDRASPRRAKRLVVSAAVGERSVGGRTVARSRLNARPSQRRRKENATNVVQGAGLRRMRLELPRRHGSQHVQRAERRRARASTLLRDMSAVCGAGRRPARSSTIRTVPRWGRDLAVQRDADEASRLAPAAVKRAT